MVRMQTPAVRTAAISPLLLLFASTGWAQSPPVRMPRVMLSAGLGGTADHDTSAPLRSLALELLATRNLVLEAEAMQWDMSVDREDPGFRYNGPNGQPIVSGPHLYYDANQGWSAGANLLYRSEPKWVSAYVGGGAFFAQQRWSTGFIAGPCVAPGNERYCPQSRRYEQTNVGVKLQAIAGADVRIAGPLRAYGSLQFTSLEQGNVRANAGIRVVARTASLADEAKRRLRRVGGVPLTREREKELAGAQVRVTLASGARRHGDFVALNETGLVVREKYVDRRYPLGDVLIVETAHHTARHAAIGGAIGGFLFGYLASCASGEGCWYEIGAVFAGIGAGAGGLIGAIYDWKTARSHVIYAASSPPVRVVPLLAPGGGGVAVALNF